MDSSEPSFQRTQTRLVIRKVGSHRKQDDLAKLAMLCVTPNLFVVFLLAHPILASAPSGPWDAFNYAPKSRTVTPTAVHSTGGSVEGALNLMSLLGKATLTNGSWVALDFGKEVCDEL